MLAIQDIAYVRYQATDLDRMEKFLTDFGLRRAARTERALYMRGYGSAHHVHVTELGDSNRGLGFGLLARSAADLSAFAQRLDAPVEESREPGGGQRVRVTDPSGFTVDVVHGQTAVPPLPHRAPLDMNHSTQRARLGRSVRLGAAPSVVMRLGHVVLLVPDYRQSHRFYHEMFGLRASDSYFAGSPENVIASFMHCGLGATYTDHHTVALITAQDGVARFDHCAFEVLDLDDLMQGNAYLQQAGHVHSWGVGRHIQGSQIFDYWRDPFGNKVEHWTDGDLVNDDSPVSVAELGGNALHQWAPPLTPEFFL
jgi:catechol 2,3-dioxygenase-like lactoylglutathione lyase family enzyme